MLRTAAPQDDERIMEIIRASFTNFAPDDRHFEQIRSLLREREFVVFAPDDAPDRIVGTAEIGVFPHAFGCSTLRRADPGDVCIDPAEQGRGYGTAMMRGIVRYLREKGYALSRLGGYSAFYARFGYVRMPRMRLDITLGGYNMAGASRLKVGPVDLPAAMRAVSAGDVWTYRDCRAELLHDGREPTVRLSAPEGEAAEAAVLLVSVYNAMYDTEIRAFRVTGDVDRALADALSAWPVAFSLSEPYSALAGNMMRVLSLRNLFTEGEAEFARRLAAFPGLPLLRIVCGDETAELPGDPAKAPVTAVLTQKQLLNLLVGAASPADYLAGDALAAGALFTRPAGTLTSFG